MQETWFRPLGREDPLEKGMATNSSILAWKFPRQRRLVGYCPGSHRVKMTELHEHMRRQHCSPLYKKHNDDETGELQVRTTNTVLGVTHLLCKTKNCESIQRMVNLESVTS